MDPNLTLFNVQTLSEYLVRIREADAVGAAHLWQHCLFGLICRR